MKRVGRVNLLGGVLLMSFFFLAVGSPAAFGADIILRFAGNHPLTHHCTRGMELYAKLVMEKMNKVKIEVYPAGQLFSDKDLVRALPTGAVDMGVMHTAMLSGLVPVSLFLDFPFFYKDRAHWHRVIDSKAGEIVKQDLEKRDLHLLYWMDFGRIDFASKMPLKTLESFKGKRIRGSGEMQLEGIRAMGASPTFLGAGEVYLALQRNTIDGATSGPSSFWERKYYEVAKYITDADYQFGVFPVLINKKIWEGLPQDVRAIMLQAGKEAQAWGRKEAEKVDTESIELLEKKGMEYYYIPEKERARWTAATSKVSIDLFMKRIGEKEQDKGKQILELAEKLR